MNNEKVHFNFAQLKGMVSPTCFGCPEQKPIFSSICRPRWMKITLLQTIICFQNAQKMNSKTTAAVEYDIGIA